MLCENTEEMLSASSSLSWCLEASPAAPGPSWTQKKSPPLWNSDVGDRVEERGNVSILWSSHLFKLICLLFLCLSPPSGAPSCLGQQLVRTVRSSVPTPGGPAGLPLSACNTMPRAQLLPSRPLHAARSAGWLTIPPVSPPSVSILSSSQLLPGGHGEDTRLTVIRSPGHHILQRLQRFLSPSYV